MLDLKPLPLECPGRFNGRRPQMLQIRAKLNFDLAAVVVSSSSAAGPVAIDQVNAPVARSLGAFDIVVLVVQWMQDRNGFIEFY